MNQIENLIISEKFDEARKQCLMRLTENRQDPIAWHYLGMCHYFTQRFDESIDAYQNAIRLQPAFAWMSCFNLSQAFLITGDLEKGFALFESRLIDPRRLSKPVPKWLGEEISGKTLLVHQDEGLGDAIQFLRYIPYLQNYHCRVLLYLNKDLHGLFQHLNVPLLTDRIYECDLHVETGSLPFCFKTTLSNILPPVKIVCSRQPEIGRIGIVWQSSKSIGPEISAPKSLNLEQWQPLLTLPGFQYVCVQKDVSPEDAAFLERHGVERPPIASFTDTVKILERCERVICVDTCVAHLSASMGSPTWILLPFNACWRWLANRTDSPWYPSVKLFRQCRNKIWDEPIQEIKQELIHCRTSSN
ncbi:MAG: hypothetical protein HW387_1721 [Parachlamydiales bacterium]|nr:hypothetical protein [Parachlamydiales bacterium]